jgi:hypothetical protein
MFNQLTTAEVVTAIGATARRAARSENPASDFDRDQLLSAYSATRHLAAELSGYAPVWDRFRTVLVQRLDPAESGDKDVSALVTALRAALNEDATPAVVAPPLCDLLSALRNGSGPSATLRADLLTELRRLADSEVDLLAHALG